MALARDLVRLSEMLRDRAEVNLFDTESSACLNANAEHASVLAQIEAQSKLDARTLIKVCLQSLAIQYDELRPQLAEVELVATIPGETPGIARTTGGVVREMIRSASREIVLLGYEFTDSGVVQNLADAVSRGVDILVICDRTRGVKDRILEMWPSDVARPRIFIDRERSDAARYASMHAKCILVDERDLLVTSANLTFHGLHGNIEIGLRATGAPAMEARKIFGFLLAKRLVAEVP